MIGTLKNERGIALVVVIFMGSILFTLIGASLLFSRLNLKSAVNLEQGTFSLHVADTGLQHALAVIPAGNSFPYSSSTPVVGQTSHPTMTGFSYSVTAVNDAGGTKAILTPFRRAQVARKGSSLPMSVGATTGLGQLVCRALVGARLKQTSPGHRSASMATIIAMFPLLSLG
jgi:hypothetical protein